MKKFFNRHWVYWIDKTKYIIIPLSIIWIGLATWRAVLLEPASDALKRLSDSNYLQVTQNSAQYDYHVTQTAGSVVVKFVWGTKGIDNSNVDQWDSTSMGTIIIEISLNIKLNALQI